MKSNPWLFGGLLWMAATAAVLAQDSKPSTAPRAAASPFAKDTVLAAPATATVKGEAINVRDQPALAGDVVTHLSRGQSVTVLEEMTLSKPKSGEPKDWSRIVLPTNAAAWIFADNVDTNTMTVSVRRANVRGGASEAYGILARLDKGTPVKEVRRAPGWIEIEPPPNASGFVASEYLSAEAPSAPPPVAAVAPEPVAPPPPVAAPPPSAAPPPAETTNTPPPVVAAAPIVAPEPVAPAPATTPTNTPPPVAAAPVVAEPPPSPAPETVAADTKPRIVTREGVVRKALNIQAPADYELRDLRSGDLTEYLQASDKNFKFYVGQRVSVTGPEMLDARWPKTPVLQIKTIDIMP